MKNRAGFSGLLFGVLVLCAVAAGGCRSKTPVSFYTLSPISVSEEIGVTSENAPIIGVGPLLFPDYLNRLQVVTRPNPGRVHFSEFNRWAGFLDKEFLKTVAENLSLLLGTPQVRVYPWGGVTEPEYRVALDVKQFEGNPGESVRLNVVWTLRFLENDAPGQIIRRSIIVEPVSGDGYDLFISAHSRAVETLSREIADTIRNLGTPGVTEPIL